MANKDLPVIKAENWDLANVAEQIQKNCAAVYHALQSEKFADNSPLANEITEIRKDPEQTALVIRIVADIKTLFDTQAFKDFTSTNKQIMQDSVQKAIDSLPKDATVAEVNKALSKGELFDDKRRELRKALLEDPAARRLLIRTNDNLHKLNAKIGDTSGNGLIQQVINTLEFYNVDLTPTQVVYQDIVDKNYRELTYPKFRTTRPLDLPIRPIQENDKLVIPIP